MEKTITDSLVLLGLDRLSIRFFLSSFKLGPANIPEIAKLAHLKRSTAYLLAKQLLSKGFLLEDHKLYANKIYAIDPEKLLQLVANKQRQLRRQEIELENTLPEIRSLYQASEIRPKIHLFEGNTGLLQVWQDILSAKTEILLWTNQQTENLFFGPANHEKFIKERLAKKIPIRVLATANLESQDLKTTDTEYLRQTKILPDTAKFSCETYIYDHKIAILDYNKDIIGIIIESDPIAASYKSIFETTWNLLP
jgi:HTH-type transcriptional regulator, sugar sensing transcriptional regulator